MASGSTRCRCGMTLVEVLVVLFVGAIFVGLLVAAILQSREAARRSQCQNTLKVLGVALHNYHDQMRSFPHGCVGNPALPPDKRWSWYLCLGNYWGHYGTPIINYRRAWDDPALRPLKLRTWKNGTLPAGALREFDVPLYALPVIKCPNGTPATHTDGQPFSDYVGTSGVWWDAANQLRIAVRAGAWAFEECTSLSDLRDGQANTMQVIESSRANGCWLAGGPATVREFLPEQVALGQGAQFGGLHNGGSMALYVDGHVRFLGADTPSHLLSEAMTIAGNVPTSQTESP